MTEGTRPLKEIREEGKKVRKMTEEFDLSEKMVGFETITGTCECFYNEEKVKEFIRRLKEEMKGLKGEYAIELIINKLAGEKLK